MTEEQIEEARKRINYIRTTGNYFPTTPLALSAMLEETLDALEVEKSETKRLKDEKVAFLSWAKGIFPDINFEALYEMTDNVGVRKE